MLDDLGRAKIVIINYHAFKLRERLNISSGGRKLLQGRGPELNTLETEGQILQRVMPDLMGLKNILVINDEAHHCYREKPDNEDINELKGEDKKAAKKENEAARLWITGIETVKRKLGVRTVFDLSAIQWLNEHTAESFAFFAVKVRVVRIGTSPLAPIFEVVARPNAWERRLQAVNEEVKSASPQKRFRREFWEYYASRHPKIAQDVVSGANSNRWREVKELGIAISSYVGKDGLGIYVRSNSGAADSASAVYHTLLPFANTLRQRLGAELGDPDDKYFFNATYQADTADRSRWAEWTDWLYEKTETYEQALRTLGE
jgi:hypothetical protein